MKMFYSHPAPPADLPPYTAKLAACGYAMAHSASDDEAFAIGRLGVFLRQFDRDGGTVDVEVSPSIVHDMANYIAQFPLVGTVRSDHQIGGWSK